LSRQTGLDRGGGVCRPILVNGNPQENLDLVADPDKDFALIMKDGNICKNMVT